MNNFKVVKNKDSNRCSLRSWNNAKCTILEIFSSLVITVLYQQIQNLEIIPPNKSIPVLYLTAHLECKNIPKSNTVTVILVTLYYKLKVILYRHVRLLLCGAVQNLQIHEWLIILYHSPLLLYTYVCSVLCGTMNDGSSQCHIVAPRTIYIMDIQHIN